MSDDFSMEDFLSFLSMAKRNTYAASSLRASSKCLLSKNYVFESGNFRYEDQYFGEYIDVGEEIVWFRSVPVWGMGYRGGMYYVSTVSES